MWTTDPHVSDPSLEGSVSEDPFPHIAGLKHLEF
jgi:hypothetical protein